MRLGVKSPTGWITQQNNNKMPFKTFRQESKQNYGNEVSEGCRMNDESLMLGAVLRIADAVEKSVEDRLRIDRELKYYTTLSIDRLGEIERLNRVISANEGAKTKLKNKLSAAHEEIKRLKSFTEGQLGVPEQNQQ